MNEATLELSNIQIEHLFADIELPEPYSLVTYGVIIVAKRKAKAKAKAKAKKENAS